MRTWRTCTQVPPRSTRLARAGVRTVCGAADRRCGIGSRPDRRRRDPTCRCRLSTSSTRSAPVMRSAVDSSHGGLGQGGLVRGRVRATRPTSSGRATTSSPPSRPRSRSPPSRAPGAAPNHRGSTSYPATGVPDNHDPADRRCPQASHPSHARRVPPVLGREPRSALRTCSGRPAVHVAPHARRGLQRRAGAVLRRDVDRRVRDLEALVADAGRPESGALWTATFVDDANLFDRATTWPTDHRRAGVVGTEKVVVDGATSPTW